MRKIPTRLRGTNFCTNSARFAPSSVRQPNDLKCTQIVWNAPKHQFSVLYGGSSAFVAKNSDTTSWHELCTSSARFAPSFVRQPNGPKYTQILRNAQKRQIRVQRGGSGAFVAKNFAQLHGTNFCTSSARFATSFITQPNGPKMRPTSTKRTKTSV